MNLGFGLSLSYNSVGIDPAVLTRAAEIVADGGVVEDIGYWNSFVNYAKYNIIKPFWTDVVAAYSPSWGVKGVATSSKLYSIVNSTHDIDQVVGASQPAIALADLNGKTRLIFDGVDDHFTKKAFTFAQPETIILGGFCNTVHADNNNIHDGFNLTSMLLLQTFVSGQVRINAGVAGPNNTIGLGTDHHVRELMNGASSALQVDTVAETTGDAGALDGDGFTLGGRNDGANPAEFKVGMVVLLNSAVDADYVSKMTSIYNFSKAAYGTP